MRLRLPQERDGNFYAKFVMSGEYSDLLAEVKSAFADFKNEKSRLSKTIHLNYFDVLEKKVLYSIAIYRASQDDFYNSIIELLETK